ncbi:uncharacterized protein TNCV_4175161 [Trichonephila clavipes]|nr:uncharacterized protein TNCV_4175161 [Trichonephila clavipes]
MKIGNNGNLVLSPFDESTPCLMIVLINCQTKLRINHLTAIKSVAILENLQAIAILALSCKLNQNSENEQTNLYQNTIEHFKQSQFTDGSFGNVYTTALITQALMSSGQGNLKNLKLSATIDYLIEHMNSSSVDFLSTYLTLPILNGKTLIDISKVDCSANPRKHGDGKNYDA